MPRPRQDLARGQAAARVPAGFPYLLLHPNRIPALLPPVSHDTEQGAARFGRFQHLSGHRRPQALFSARRGCNVEDSERTPHADRSSLMQVRCRRGKAAKRARLCSKTESLVVTFGQTRPKSDQISPDSRVNFTAHA